MEENFRRRVRAGLILAFIAVIIGLLVWSRIQAYSLAPTYKPLELRTYPPWLIPLVYLYDYFSHAWICLLFAFSMAGIIYELIPKEVLTRYMSSSRITGYTLALGIAPLLTVCSCTMVPLFAGILYAGAGIGPALTFLLMAPASNFLAIMLTGELISWEVSGVRIAASIVVALTAGIVISKTPWGRQIEKEQRVCSTSPAGAVEVAKLPLDERLVGALRFAGYLAKRIMPYFIAGLIAVSYLEAYLPEEIIRGYLTGVGGVLLASVLGGPLYTPTLVEIVLGRGIWVREGVILSKGALLSWLMGQPYDFANALAVSRITKWKVVVSYVVIAWVGSVFFGMLYGLLSGSL